MRKEYDFSRAKRGAVIPTPAGKTRITIRIDDDLLDWFRGQVHAAGGGNYQTLINSALREHVSSRREPLEDTLRRVVREEWAAYVPSAQPWIMRGPTPKKRLRPTGRKDSRK